MASRLVSSPLMGPRSYEDFIPSSNWIRDEGYDLLLIELPGFKKEHLKVQLDSFGNLRITGESHHDGNRWRRFQKEFSLPDNYNTREIRAKFESDKLTVTLPKHTVQATEPATRPTHPTRAEPATPIPMPPSTQAGPTTAKTSLTSQTPQSTDQTEKDLVELPANGKGKVVKEEYVQSGKIGEQVREKRSMEGNRGCFNFGIMKMKRNQLLVINVAVAVMVLVGVGFYVGRIEL